MKEIVGQVSVKIVGRGICHSCRKESGLTAIGNCVKCHGAVVFQLLSHFGLEFFPVSNLNHPA
jgi:hypothetical protein